MAEKCTRNLPGLRVTERLETELMRLASREELSLSALCKLALHRYAFGHATSVLGDDENVTDFGALQCDADDLGGRRR